jgi:hypothetical protein
MNEKSPETITELRALEANCAAAYFRAWQGTPINYDLLGNFERAFDLIWLTPGELAAWNVHITY